MAHSDRHRNHLTLVPPASTAADTGSDEYNAGRLVAGVDPGTPRADVAFTRLGGTVPYQIVTRRATYHFCPVPHLDQPPLAAPATTSSRRGPVDRWQRARHHLSHLRDLLLRGALGGPVRVWPVDPCGERPVPRNLSDGLVGASDVRDDRVRDSV